MKNGRGLRPERGADLGLSAFPAWTGGAEGVAASIGKPDSAGPAVVGIGLEADESLPLERLQRACERRRVHDHALGQGADGDAVEAFQMGEDAELGHRQARRLDVPVVDLGDAPGGLAHPRTGAGKALGCGFGRIGHGGRILHMQINASPILRTIRRG